MFMRCFYFPIGVITIREIKAPKGYLINDEVFVRKVTEDGADNEEVSTYNAPTVKETARRDAESFAKG